MADYLTTDTELTSIANAIRSKGGTSASLAYPTDFVTAINAIARGGNHTVTIDNFDSSSVYSGWVQYDGTTYHSGDSFVYEDAIPKKKIKIGFSLISYPTVSSWRILDIDGTVLHSYTFPSAPYNNSYEMEVDDDITINCTSAYGTATVQLYKSAYYGANATASAVISPYQFYDKSGVLTQGSVIARAVSPTQLTPSVYSTTITSGAYNTTATVTVLAEATTINPAATSQTINASTKFFNKITVNSAPLSKISKTYTSVNQTETINTPAGYYGISSVTVTVAIPAKSSNAILTSTTQTYIQNNYSVTVPPAKLSAVATSYTSNGTYTISVPQNYYGISTATVTVSVSGGTPSYVVTNLTAGDAIIDKTFYQATSTTIVTRVTGAGFLDRRSSVYTLDGYYGITCGSTYVTIQPDWDCVIGGIDDPNAPDPDYYPHSDTGIRIGSNWMAMQMGLIDSPNNTTSSLLVSGVTILGITGTGGGGGGGNPTFTIDGVSYEFDSSTTYWYDWVYSNYAPSGSSIETDPGGDPYIHIGGTASNYGVSGEYPGDEIIEGASYITAPAYQIIDLTGTTWYFNSDLDYPFGNASYSINFNSNGVWTTLSLDDYTMYYKNPMAGSVVYGPSSGPPSWYNQSYRTISITSGADVSNANLYYFLTNNATQQ